MAFDELDGLIARFIEGSLPPAERRALYERAARDASIAQRIAEAQEMAALLELATHSDASFVRSVLEQYGRDGATESRKPRAAGGLNVFSAAIHGWRPARMRLGWRAGALVIAAAAIFILAVAHWRSSPALARLVSVAGSVTLSRDGRLRPVKSGD